MKLRRIVLLASLSPFAALYACGSGDAPSHDAPWSDGAAFDAGAPGSPDATSGFTTTPSPDHAAHVVMTTVVPAGVQCIGVIVSGSTSETVLAAVTPGAASASVSLGVLQPGAITVLAKAYNSVCPATGAPPSWLGDPVQVTVVAGETVTIPLVLHATSSGTGNVVFSQPAISIAAGTRTSYAVLADGTVRAWGDDGSAEFGAIADGGFAATGGPPSTTPVVVQGVSNAKQVVAGNGFACVLRNDSSVVCWGNSSQSRYISGVPLNVPPLVEPFTASALAAGLDGVAYLTPSGQIGSINDGTPEVISAAPTATAITAPAISSF